MNEELLTVIEAAKELHVNERTVRKYILDNKLKGYKYGKKIFIERKDLEAFKSGGFIRPAGRPKKEN